MIIDIYIISVIAALIVTVIYIIKTILCKNKLIERKGETGSSNDKLSTAEMICKLMIFTLLPGMNLIYTYEALLLILVNTEDFINIIFKEGE